MTIKTEWHFDAEEKPTNNANSAGAEAPGAIRVRVMTLTQAIAIADTLRPQVEALYTPVLAGMKDPPVTAASVTESVFTIKEEAHFVFLAYEADDALDTKAIGFSRVREEVNFGVVFGAPLAIDLSLSQQQQEAAQRALFTASQATGEALAQKLLVVKRGKAKLGADESKPVPTSTAFWRSLFAATEFAKSLLAEHGFIDEKVCVEMSMDLRKLEDLDRDQAPTFPGGLEVKPIDLNDASALLAVYEVIKLAFGPNPASFEAWKIHYAQQPRFAPEVSFVAWDGNEPVAAIVLERIVEGEGGGEDELPRLYATNGKLLAEKKKASKTSAATTEELGVSEELQKVRLGDISDASSAALEFAPDFDKRKARIMQEATVAYVCGAATKDEYRSKGLASGLLQMAFRKAAKLAPPLQEIVFGTDLQNKSALRAYAWAGMVETRSFSSGMVTKSIPFVHP